MLNPDSLTMFFIAVVILLMSCATAVHILLNKSNEPVSATLWLFIVFSFPLAGMAVYVLLGINKVYATGEKMRMAREIIHSEKKSPVHSAIKRHLEEQKKYMANASRPETGCPEYAKMFDRILTEAVPLSGNRVELLEDGTKAYPKMLTEMSTAKSSIHLQSFIIMDDPVGREIFNLLGKKANEGVKIKIIYDRFGSLKAGIRSKLFAIKNANVQVRAFSLLNLSSPWTTQLRNHRKLLVIDGEKAFVGGINISRDNDSAFAGKDRYIHDLHCFIRGPAVGELQFSFMRDWFYVTGEKISGLFKEEYFPAVEARGDSIVRVVSSGPGQYDGGTEKIFVTAAACARKYIWIMTPYFVPDISFWKMLRASSAKGVEIRIIVPQKNNHWYVQYATRSLYPNLLEAGIRIFEKKGPFSHAKAMLVDGEWAVMGSSNCDVRSFRLNYELDFIASGGDFLNILHSQFLKEISESEEILFEDVIKKSLSVEIIERACSLLTPIL
jgi:cardiolipin synthase